MIGHGPTFENSFIFFFFLKIALTLWSKYLEKLRHELRLLLLLLPLIFENKFFWWWEVGEIFQCTSYRTCAVASLTSLKALSIFVSNSGYTTLISSSRSNGICNYAISPWNLDYLKKSTWNAWVAARIHECGGFRLFLLGPVQLWSVADSWFFSCPLVLRRRWSTQVWS